MKITVISDLHGHYPKDLPGGDLLIIAGDLTASDRSSQYLVWREWLQKQDYKKKVFIAGNHDGCIESGHFYFSPEWIGAEYLFDSGTEFEGLKVWGSPWSSQFPGINPHCCAFTRPFMEPLKDRWDLIPDDTDILITHTPPYGILDKVKTEFCASVGDKDLLEEVTQRIKPKLHIFGHIHGFGLKYIQTPYTLFVNASYVDDAYKPRKQVIECLYQDSLFTPYLIQTHIK